MRFYFVEEVVVHRGGPHATERSLAIAGKGARDGARVGIMSVGARELRVGRPSRDKTRIPLMSVSGFNNLQSHPFQRVRF